MACAHSREGRPVGEWEPLFTPFGDGEGQCRGRECGRCRDLEPDHGHLNKVAWWAGKFAAEMFVAGSAEAEAAFLDLSNRDGNLGTISQNVSVAGVKLHSECSRPCRVGGVVESKVAGVGLGQHKVVVAFRAERHHRQSLPQHGNAVLGADPSEARVGPQHVAKLMAAQGQGLRVSRVAPMRGRGLKPSM